MALKITYNINGLKRRTSNGKPAQQFKEALNSGVTFNFYKGMAKTAEKARERQIMIMAIFFQRLCSRTPIDEEYKYGPNGEQIHIPDDDYTRLHWFIQMGSGKKVYAKDIVAANGPEVFDTYNNSSAINFIFEQLNTTFKGKLLQTFRIGNDTDPEKFHILEYGGYKKESGNIHKGEKESHGVKNKRSVQAPAGMLRITKAELDRIAKTPSVKNEVYRYKRQVSHKMPTERELQKMLQFIKKNKISGRDIETLLK